jgi:hypothetical protein
MPYGRFSSVEPAGLTIASYRAGRYRSAGPTVPTTLSFSRILPAGFAFSCYFLDKLSSFGRFARYYPFS